MNVLLSCWFIVDSVLIPEGFQKWRRLSYFIHPVLLILCQILLLVAPLISLISYLAFSPFRRIWHGVIWVFMMLKGRLTCLFSVGESVGSEAAEEEDIRYEIDQVQQEGLRIIDIRGFRVLTIENGQLEVLEEIKCVVEEGDNREEQELLVDICEIPSLKSEADTEEENEGNDEEAEAEADAVAAAAATAEKKEEEEEEEVDAVAAAAATAEEKEEEEEEEEDEEEEEEETNGFYKKYTERMKWFDLLNQERTSGISAILKSQLGHSDLLVREELFNMPTLYHGWSKQAQRNLIRSVESDVEMAYVGQTCLCWEGLHYQYRKVEAIVGSNEVRGAFYDETARKFQQFQVLLERFTEEEGIKGKRYWNYVQCRFPHKNLLQVPEVSAKRHLKENRGGIPGQAIFASEALRVIEKSIRAFWVFLKTDSICSSWNLRSLLLTYPQVENPKDLELLSELRKALRKKELRMKNLEGKSKCWLKRTMEDSLRMDILFTMIEMKLVSRVLKMSIISTDHLKWCQEKLNNIELSEGRVVRAQGSCLFPLS